MLAASAIVLMAAIASRTEAHGYLKQPKPSWKDGPNVGWITMVDNYWDIGSGGDQVGKFKTMAKEKSMSVKDVVLDMVKGQKCGNTLENGDAQPVPSDGTVKWLGNEGGGFTHTGPCEIYLDDKMVLHGDDCEDEYKGGAVGSTQTSDMPVDFSSCNGKCTLAIYWLAFQNAQWQAYGGVTSDSRVVNCVPLKGGGGGGSTPTTEGASKEPGDSENKEKQGEASGSPKTEQQTEQAPSTESEASSTGKQENPAEQTPAATTQITQAPSTPSAEDTKCNAPARRLRKKLAKA